MTGDVSSSLRRLGRRVLGGRASDPGVEQADLVARGLLEIGHRSYGAFRVLSYPNDPPVRIGAWTSLAHDVELMPGGNHRIDRATSYPMRRRFGMNAPGEPWSKGAIEIGNDVWVGRGAKVLGGVTIGDGAVVAAYAVVVGDVAPYTIVGGNPAKEIGRRLTVEQAAAMARIAWWTWDEDLVRERLEDFESSDVDAFIARYDAVPPP